MTAGEQAVTDALALEDLARVARHLRAIDAARPTRARPRRRVRPTVAAGVDGHDGRVWWAAGPDVDAVALALEVEAARPPAAAAPGRAPATPPACFVGSPQRPLPSPAEHGPVRLAIVDPDERKLRLARMVVATGEPWRGGDDVWFVPEGLVGGGAGAGVGTATDGCTDDGSAASGPVAFLAPAHPPAIAGPAAFELMALARWLGLEAAGAPLVDAALRWLGAAPGPVAVVADDAGRADLAATAARLHARGARVFVDLGAGAQGDLAPALARALDGRAHVTVTALAPGSGPLARLDRALAALWAEGAAVLPDALHRPAPAGPCPALGPWRYAGVPTEPSTIDQGEA
jgi:hypothetical protein